VVARIDRREVLPVPVHAERDHVVVGDLLDAHLGRGREGAVMAHPHEPLSQPAQCLERLPERLARADVLEVDAPVPKAGERLVGERRQLLCAHAGVGLHADRVQVVVVRVPRRADDRAVLPRLDQVAELGVDAVIPGPRASLDVSHRQAIGARSASRPW
jgi:hypothetical protein